MSLKIDFGWFGDVQVSREILRAGHHASDLRPVFERIADFFMNIEDRQFGSEGRFASGGWQPLKEATRVAKERAGLDPRILHATLDLRNSLTKRGDPNQDLIIDKGILFFSSKQVYFKFHQKGTVNMAQRRPVEFTKSARIDVMKMIQRFVMTGEIVQPGRGSAASRTKTKL